VKENLPSGGSSTFVLILQLRRQPRLSNPHSHLMSDYQPVDLVNTTWERATCHSVVDAPN
jgi:hypothetical protein